MTLLLRITRGFHSRLRQHEHTYMVLVAVLIGLLGGLCAVGFRELIKVLQEVFWNASGDAYTLDYIRNLSWKWKILAPAGGGLIVGVITYYFAREAKGHGVPEVMEAVAVKGGRIRIRVIIAKMFASAACIASGGSVGREGPIVQIGSSLGSAIGQILNISEHRLRTLVGCGAAAGIAATFNAPVAGALFAVEVILGDFGVPQFSPIVVSSVAATVVSRHFLGDFPAFIVPEYSLDHAYELVAYVALGILAGLAALAFVKILYAGEDLFDAIPIYEPIKVVAGGAIVGGMALVYPEILGVGYEAINEALQGQAVWHLLLILGAAKIIAVSLTIGSGGSGGIFAPSLFIGAMLGGAVGTFVHTLWPESTAQPGAYALVGMGAVVAAGTHAPVTAILIIFELTASYKIILPLMISCIIATLLATRLSNASIYTLKLLRRGVDIRAGQSLNVLHHLKVSDVMRPVAARVHLEDSVTTVIARFMENPGSSVFVTDDQDRLHGVITTNEIRPILDDATAFHSLLIAADLMLECDYPTVGPDDHLDYVMEQLGSFRFEVPIVQSGRIVGTIWPEDVIRSYNAELFKREMASTMASTLANDRKIENIPGLDNANIAEIAAPRDSTGKTLAELDLRNRHQLSVLLIKRKTDQADHTINLIPDADYVVQRGDRWLVMGPADRIRRIDAGI